MEKSVKKAKEQKYVRFNGKMITVREYNAIQRLIKAQEECEKFSGQTIRIM